MAVTPNQPKLRFSKYDPNGLAGVSWLPKVINVEKAITTATENDDFWQTPTDIYITRAVAVCSNACDADTTVTLGTDGTADALVKATQFSVETLNNNYLFNTGLYLPAGDKLRIAVGGTPAEGQVRFVIEYFEIGNMFAEGKHFNE